jgi:hypothetical protein
MTCNPAFYTSPWTVDEGWVLYLHIPTKKGATSRVKWQTLGMVTKIKCSQKQKIAGKTKEVIGFFTQQHPKEFIALDMKRVVEEGTHSAAFIVDRPASFTSACSK